MHVLFERTLTNDEQVLQIGERYDPRELCDRIDAVSHEDIHEFVRKAFSAPPAIATIGDSSQLASYEAIEYFFRQQINK